MGDADQLFCYGAAYGIVIAGLLGFVLSQIRAARMKFGQQFKPFDQFPDAQHPHLNSAKVVRQSRFALLGCVFWSAIFFILAYYVLQLTCYLINNIIE